MLGLDSARGEAADAHDSEDVGHAGPERGDRDRGVSRNRAFVAPGLVRRLPSAMSSPTERNHLL